jgi:hypothetical protein
MRMNWFVVAVLMTASLPGSVAAEDTPKRSAELQVLDRYLGEWETTITNKATGEKINTIQSRKWSREGKFILSEDQDVGTKRESHFLMTYDAKSKQYRACFINDEFTVPLLGTWDEKARVMTWKSSDVAFKHAAVHRFLDKDTVEWTMTVTSPEGKVVLELSAKQTRRKK